ncbi:MAG: PIN domain-containing protein [Dehalococcoidia bacterium]
MGDYFVDTAYHVAIVDPKDDLHAAALRLAGRLARDSSASFLTSDIVLAEFLTFLSGRGGSIRGVAVNYVDDITREANVTVVRLTRALFDAGLELYRRRADKTYSMTDCISMVICRERRISDILTGDHDFEQEGFRILL